MLAAAVGAAVLASGRQAPIRPPAAAAAASTRSALASPLHLPATARPAFVPGEPKLLRGARSAVRWAPVVRPVIARREPRSGAAAVAKLDRRTPEGTTNIVLPLGQARMDGILWERVELSVLPNGTTGWVPRTALGGYVFVETRLIVDRRRLVAMLVRGGRVVFRAPVGIGRPSWPTPAGTFYVRDRLTRFRSPFYGPIAFGTSARSPVLTEWPGGGYIGIHGTDEPGLLPGRVSHGCIRLRNRDILRLDRLMPVGTPITIV